MRYMIKLQKEASKIKCLGQNKESFARMMWCFGFPRMSEQSGGGRDGSGRGYLPQFPDNIHMKLFSALNKKKE